MVGNWMLSPWNQEPRPECPCSSICIHLCTGVLSQCSEEEETITSMQIGKKWNSLFADNMIYVENLKESTKATRTMTEFNRIIGHKVNMQSVTVFL